ncbi:BTB/POZ domain-containing protein 9 [Tetrabaena socialis]|uniref:BTB/POZ domain-containing protein 9 n=1 Tax=Tetrabaena socialis TaxID=47790 RepID=A0A2J7ZU30_9CHLO|nr:BTB/POZ domain-containing protein 9 [Tetrabaena socialis]|eukprot:PNH03772.1 BTB/POZ domain-containing protein 9 [Tetrabaena socialis]
MDPIAYKLAAFAAPNVLAACIRPQPRSADDSLQVLIFCELGVCPLLGLHDAEGVRLGPPLRLTGLDAPALGRERLLRQACDALYDAYTGLTVVAVGSGLVTIDSDNHCTWLAGLPNSHDMHDGVDAEARFCFPRRLAAGSRPGVLLVADLGKTPCGRGMRTHLRQLQLLRDGGGGGSGRGAWRMVITTLSYVSDGPKAWRWLYSGPVRWLLLAERRRDLLSRAWSSALGGWLRWAMPHPSNPATGVSGDGHGPSKRLGAASSSAATASAACVWGVRDVLIDRQGTAFLARSNSLDVLRPGGAAAISLPVPAAHGMGLARRRLLALPRGRVLLYGVAKHEAVLLRPPGDDEADVRPYGIDGSSGPPSSLSDDLGALLQQPGATADVTVLVGDRAFPLHRIILIARCPYYARLLTGGFADAAEPVLSLPHADANAFETVVRHIYTGDTAHLRPPLLRPVAVLADRLLLPALCGRAQELLLRGVVLAPGSAPSELLWAEQAGMEWLLARLEAYFLAHRQQVVALAPQGMRELLAAASPELLERLLLPGM